MIGSLRTLLIGLTFAVVAPAPMFAQAVAGAERPSPLAMTAANQTAAAEAARGTPRADSRSRPGDVLRYRLTFTNNIGQPVRGMTFTSPLAAGLTFEGGSVRASRDDARAVYSADGGKTWSPRPMEDVVIDGKRVRRAVDPSRYTHVRWTVDGWLATNAAVTAEYDAKLATAPRTVATNADDKRDGR